MEEKNRIPTIFDEKISTNKESSGRGYLPSLPTLTDINDCAIRIYETSDLSIELEKKNIDIYQIARLIAEAKYKEMLWDYHNRQKKRAVNVSIQRWKRNYKGPQECTRKERLQHLALQAAGEFFTIEEAYRVKRSSTKKRPYLTQLLVVLECIFSAKTEDDPYKYMAALFNLFNMRPEKACNKCIHFNSAKKVCIDPIMFDCPNHDNTRHSLWQMTKAAKKEIPGLSARLADPANRI